MPFLAGCVGACETSDEGFAKFLNRPEVGAGAEVDAADVLVAAEVVTGALSCVFPRLGNGLMEGGLLVGAAVPEVLDGLLKKSKAFDAAAAADTASGAED